MTSPEKKPTAEKKAEKKSFAVRFTKLFINNDWVDSASGKSFATVDPSTGETISSVSEATKPDVDRAVAAARQAFEAVGPGSWRALGPSGRARCLFRLADLVEKNAHEIAWLEARSLQCLAWLSNVVFSVQQSTDNGKTLGMALGVDVAGVAGVLRYFAGEPAFWMDGRSHRRCQRRLQRQQRR